MSIIEPVIRPPSEAMSFLLQVTTGCSANHCSFCGAYMNKPFRVKEAEEIFCDIERGAHLYPETRRVFLMDGDALVLNNRKLVPILKKLKKSFSRLTRVSSYANGYNITSRKEEDLQELVEHKLNLLYIGLESGSESILEMQKKRSTAAEMIEAVQRAKSTGMKSSVIVLLGLGGKKYTSEHVEETAKVLNAMQPRYLSFLSVMLIPGTELHMKVEKGDFQELKPLELLKECHDIIENLDLKKTIFRSNHASNFLRIEGRFPQDKGKLLDLLQKAIAGKTRLVPDFLRGL